MRSSNWIAAALLMSGLTASAAQPAWVHEKENGRIEILDPAGGKRAVLTLHAPGKVTVRKIENRCFSIQTDFAGKIIPGVYGIRNGKENSFDFFWKLEGEWSRRIGSGAFVFSLDPSLRGKTLFFLEENGKQSTVSLPQEKNLTRWLRPPFNRKIVQRIDVPLSSGTLRIDGAGCEVACMVYGYNSGDFRLFPKNGYLQGEVTIQYLPFLITPIDISPAANRSFADDVADRTMGRAAGPIRENSRIFLNSRKNSCTRTASGSTLHRGRKPAWFSGKGSRGLSPKRKSQPAGNRSTGSICCMPPRGAEKRKKLSAVLKSSIPTAAARPFRSATPWM